MTSNSPDDASGLRERISQHPSNPQQASDADVAKKTVVVLNDAEERKKTDEQEKRTFGRTPDGTGKSSSTVTTPEMTASDARAVFTVPQTHDMVSQLLSPSQPKNLSDLVILAVLAGLILCLYLLPSFLRIPVFAVIFSFWRACYNAGIGWLLQMQSNDRRMVVWAKRSGIFEPPSSGKNKYPQFYNLLKREMESKIPKDYKFESAPLEYNTWLLFRRFVDLVLMCDFVSYSLFAIACGGTPEGESIPMTLARWGAGILLFLFNLWVKLDAHRVVKDYAWYWGDFFFLIDQELTFDGVFEMAPHPMYSVGYAGYYGYALMAASYKVLFISILAHAAQFAFLGLVENPHIEKTYNSPPPKRQIPEAAIAKNDQMPDAANDVALERDEYERPGTPPPQAPAPVHHLLGVKNIDFHRITDVSVVLLQMYMIAFAALTPSSGLYQTFFVANAVVWRLWYSLGIGYILDRQSNKKSWTRHFIKYGQTTDEAWRQWKGIYHLSMAMCYASFVAAAWKMYHLPSDWIYGMVLLRHVIGFALIALQMWTVVSIYDSLGEFGWFFGDFFFDDKAPTLNYSGIYRFLNNPERILGLAGVWGAATITWSKTVFFLAFLSHILTLFFLQFVERPHMQRLYGESLREHSGLSKSLRRSLPDPIRHWQGNLDTFIDRAMDSIEDAIGSVKPMFVDNLEALVEHSIALFKKYPSQVAVPRLAPDLAGYDPNDYSISLQGTPSSVFAELDKRTVRERENPTPPERRTSTFRPLMFEYGAPIKVRWTAPLNHSKKDWIGLYMISDNNSREVTRVSSQGRWIATNHGAYDSANSESGILVSDQRITAADRKAGEKKDYLSGEMEFSSDKLWWTTGVFEFRYHHDGKHNVMAMSLPFEIRIGKFDEDDVEVDANGTLRGAVEKALLPVVRNCFDRDPDIAPSTVEEGFGALVERDGKYAKRVVFAIQHM